MLLGTALASNEVPPPCPELDEHEETSLQAILDKDDVTSPAIRTIDSTGKQENVSKTDNASDRDTGISKIATQFPGVTSSDLPRFRRHMFRTDI